MEVSTDTSEIIAYLYYPELNKLFMYYLFTKLSNQ